MRIAFAGTPEFAVPSLRELVASGHETVGVFTQPDRPAGRGRKLTSPPVKQVAAEAGVPVFQPQRLSRADLESATAGSGLDLLVVIAFGQILPQPVLDYARLGALNLHASLLPRWRGAAPIARTLLAGDTVSGVSVMRMVPSLDAGPVVLTRCCPIAADETAASLHDRLAALAAQALTAVLEDPEGYIAGATAQDPERITYAPKLKRDEGRIDWSQPAWAIERQVRALQPWPCAWTELADGPLRVLASAIAPGPCPGGEPGTVVSAGRDGIDVVTGQGLLRLLRVQPAGRQAMAAGAFANARTLVGRRLEVDG